MDFDTYCKIDEEKQKLVKLVEQRKSFLDPEVIRMSQEIDELILKLIRKQYASG